MKLGKNTPNTVEKYLKSLPDDMSNTLEKVRKVIKSTVPKADEVIHYQLPAFKLNGMPFAAFGAFKEHCSYFTMSHVIMKELKDELSKYHTSGVTIHFPPGKPLPASLIKKLVKAKLRENDLRAARKLRSKRNKVKIKLTKH
jgi:uncharacterized protein YdhG (YjbR/CyaY superfamily)